MNKQAFDQGFIQKCAQYGITNSNQINYLYKKANVAANILGAGLNSTWTAGLGGLAGAGYSYLTDADLAKSILYGAGAGAGVGVLDAATGYNLTELAKVAPSLMLPAGGAGYGAALGGVGGGTLGYLFGRDPAKAALIGAGIGATGGAGLGLLGAAAVNGVKNYRP